ncbi:MAG: T9SS type A sorting domain-containing protein [Bacteroidales bacterium]|nr:T9SS type A sorting domain-containing protein [Bacteroidales bacterium]
MGKKLLLNTILIILSLDIAVSQELVIGLQTNNIIRDNYDKNKEAKGLTADTLNLPFFDDFSRVSISPDAGKWSDDFAFINDTYSADQITTGVATLDVLNNTGRLYEAASNIVFEADHLTSQPINLNLSASDSIRLSFYFQPGGLGDMPEENDSLVLQLYAPAEEKWYAAWRTTAVEYSHFKPVVIRIDNARFLKKGFRFRFINYASLSANLTEPSMIGNCDHWNIDYIVLDKYRNDADTIFQDVAFRSTHRSLLNTHESMPLSQFNKVAKVEMGLSIPMHYRNNDIIVRNVTRNFEVWDVYENSLAKSIPAGAKNADPKTNVDDQAELIYTFSTGNTDSALFRITSWLITDNFDPKENDTVVYYQRFSNYFAFDDGSSEGGYGVNGLGSKNAMVAYRFKSFIQDTLRAIKICFNDSYLNANQRIFDLMVWDDLEGVPGNVLYSQEKEMVQQGEAINGFYTYRLKDAVMVDDIFYVGWKQRTETFLNAGLDINTPHGGKQFYWINGNWIRSAASGSIMIRPVTGHPLVTSINDIKYKERIILHFYPNPAGDFINLDNEEMLMEGNLCISIIDLQGRKVLETRLTERIDISSLHDGMYTIVATRNGNPIGYNRLIKIR